MKLLNVSSINETGKTTSLSQISAIVEGLTIPNTSINCINWPEFGYKPETYVKLVLLSDGLFLHYKVLESNIRALIDTDNGAVYTDSCAEFFIDPTGNGDYYNFEFNCIGTLLMGYGKNRHNRESANSETLSSVIREPSLGKVPFVLITENKWWKLLVFIPFTAFFKHNLSNLNGLSPRCNFYKCGNSTKVPHYVTWSSVETTEPDFHRPEFFGKILLTQ